MIESDSTDAATLIAARGNLSGTGATSQGNAAEVPLQR